MGIGIGVTVAVSMCLSLWAFVSTGLVRDESESIAARAKALQRQVQGGRTLSSASTVEKEIRAAGGTGNKGGATTVGRLVAERAKAAGITRVVFDRGGFLYHGRVAAVGDAAREAGMEF